MIRKRKLVETRLDNVISMFLYFLTNFNNRQGLFGK